jgi:hypothetical protein
MALRAIAVESTLELGVPTHVTQQGAMVRAGGSRAVTGVAPQAQECRWLVEQVVGDRTVGIVADAAILGDGRVFIGEGALFFRMATVANLIHGLLSQVVFILSVPVVAVGTDHLAFLDGMVRRQTRLCIDVGVALVTYLRLIDRHR